MAPAAAASKVVRRTGKENAPPARNTKARTVDADEDMGDDDSFGGGLLGDEGPKATKGGKSTSGAKSAGSGRPLKPSRTQASDDEAEEDGESGRSASELKRKLTAMTAERDRLRSQRDGFSKQFEELSKLRTTDMESVFDKYKEKTALQAKTQTDLIANLSALNEKLQTKVQNLEKTVKAAISEPPAKADPKEVKALKEELARARSDMAAKDEKITSLEREYKAEVEHSRSLQASKASGSSSGASVAQTSAASSSIPEEAEKDQQAIRLYEDLTDLNISNVKVRPAKHGKEVVFNCVQTVDKRSVNFKLRAFLQPDPDLVAKRADNPWVPMLHYTPEHLDMERDTELLDRLGLFKTEFTMPRDQVGMLWEQLKLRISTEGEFEAFGGEEE
ncbi:hypothetical protein EHS25_000162 [Saitozyma podzolica]|uniref:Monopolin complex subunit Csm1/Pcs1 C-terminal domain-containing protein n=1 Tax=Saitozyma podzolica TaxID=1890683 RepID=A0A427YVL2_9TREE|nr:hypothetical protein EHS25_000162 [Saitozyma podzolica]